MWSKTEQQLNNWFISHGANVAKITVSNGNLAQHTPHYLPRSCLWQTWSFLDEVRLSKRTDLLSHCTAAHHQTTLNDRVGAPMKNPREKFLYFHNRSIIFSTKFILIFCRCSLMFLWWADWVVKTKCIRRHFESKNLELKQFILIKTKTETVKSSIVWFIFLLLHCTTSLHNIK